ncbi:Ubiquinone biosynthesis O-methyltransferase [uncultured archaeon]|nr:Ubiquinone biosynthesis O-methyltransferase [uncultured archaeon]
MGKLLSKVQVKRQHYNNSGYNSIFRFLSYQHQIELILGLKPKKILEIGVGNKTLSNYLKQSGLSITTCDIDKSLKPDVVGDILNLPFKDNEFDAVVAFEVLEHLPFEKFDKALSEIHRVTKKNAIISLPYPCFHFSAAIKFPLINKLIKSPIPNFSIRIPKFYKNPSFDGEHYWELGQRGRSIREIREHLEKKFGVLNQNHPVMEPYHEFFVLEKK